MTARESELALPAELAAPQCVLVRYGELSLKGGNRLQFESQLVRNMKTALRSIGKARLERHRGRILVTPPARVEECARRLQDVFGIKSVSPVWTVEREATAIVERAGQVLGDALQSFAGRREIPFRVSTTRADKRFPITSSDFDRVVADHVIPHFPALRVNLDEPEVELGIDIRSEHAYVFVHRYPGPGGLPVGTQGRALCLLSGGIDSPVAAWMGMKRGLSVSFVTFHSYPYIGDSAKHKVIALARALARFQNKARLYVVPFADVQIAIREATPESYRTVLYRRMMQRIAARLAARFGFRALITGDSLGQVASQTLSNIDCIGSVVDMPLLRPLIGFDKDETIAVARRIGTFDLSSMQEPDCCTLFMPAHPIIYGKRAQCEEAEAQLDVDGLVDRAVENVEIVEIEDA